MGEEEVVAQIDELADIVEGAADSLGLDVTEVLGRLTSELEARHAGE